MRRCGQAVVCPSACRCGAEVKAELEAERALTARQDTSGTDTQPDTQSPPAIDSGRLRTIYGLVAAMTRGNR